MTTIRTNASHLAYLVMEDANVPNGEKLKNLWDKSSFEAGNFGKDIKAGAPRELGHLKELLVSELNQLCARGHSDYGILNRAGMREKMRELENYESRARGLRDSMPCSGVVGFLSHGGKLLFSPAYRKLSMEVENLSMAIFEIIEQRKQLLSDLVSSIALPKYVDADISKYSLIQLRKIYWLKDPQKGVAYFSKKLKSDFKVRVSRGQLFRRDGITPIDSLRYYKDGILDYVLSADGSFYLGPPAQIVHHSSFLAGGPVLGAGEVIVRNGKVIQLNNRSGHYRPNFKHLLQTFVQLSKMSVVSSDAEIQFYPLAVFRAKDLSENFDLFGPAPWDNNKIQEALTKIEDRRVAKPLYSRDG